MVKEVQFQTRKRGEREGKPVKDEGDMVKVKKT